MGRKVNWTNVQDPERTTAVTPSSRSKIGSIPRFFIRFCIFPWTVASRLVNSDENKNVRESVVKRYSKVFFLHLGFITYGLNFLPSDGCVTGVIVILVRALHFRVSCVTDVFTQTVPRIAQISLRFQYVPLVRTFCQVLWDALHR